MTSRERVLTALRRQEPDRVPYCELWVDRPLADKLAEWGGRDAELTKLESNPYTVEEAKALAESLRTAAPCPRRCADMASIPSGCDLAQGRGSPVPGRPILSVWDTLNLRGARQ